MKLLSIGNSFSQDAQSWLHRIAVANGVELETTNLVIGGCSLETHWNHVLDGEKEYWLELNGTGVGRQLSLEEGLALDTFDVVTLQQASHYSGRPQSYVPYLPNLVAYVREKQPGAQLYFHQTWAYEIDSDHGGFIPHNRDQQEMYRRICDCAELVKALVDLPILPCGPVIQRLRDTVPAFDYKGGSGLSLNRDGFHLSEDYGRYTAAAVWFRVLTGKLPRTDAFEELDSALLEQINTTIEAVIVGV